VWPRIDFRTCDIVELNLFGIAGSVCLRLARRTPKPRSTASGKNKVEKEQGYDRNSALRAESSLGAKVNSFRQVLAYATECNVFGTI
jgi:hypothetical protein